MGALIVLLAVPPTSMLGAWGLALFADRHGNCRRCSRWPERQGPGIGTASGPAARA